MSAADIVAILQGAVTTASLSCIAIVLGLPLGLLLAITRWARVPGLDHPLGEGTRPRPGAAGKS